MSESASAISDKIEVVFEAVMEHSSSEEPPMSEWSSVEAAAAFVNPKKKLFEENLFSPGSGEVCLKYIEQSDSAMLNHVYYRYPAVTDPGIQPALLTPHKSTIYANNGQDRYLALCKEMDQPPCRLFYKGLLESEINLSYYGLSSINVFAMAQALQYNQTVTVLTLTDNFLSLDACYHLSQMLTYNSTLSELNLEGCRIGSEGMLNLEAGIKLSRCLVKINLSRNNLLEEGGEIFAKGIYEGATITEVSLSKNELGPRTAVALAEALQYVNTITHLDLSWNNFFTPGPTAKLFDLLAESRVLKELNLSWNAIEGFRAATSLSAITLVPTLQSLDLSNNRLRDTDVITVLIQNLHKAKRLQNFNLSNNPMTPSDAFLVLQKMLRPRVKIQQLWMDNVCVPKLFMETLEKVRAMKARKNFNITYGRVLENWSLVGQRDARELLLQRAHFLASKKGKRGKVALAPYFLQYYKDNMDKPCVPVKDFVEHVQNDGPPLDMALLTEIAIEFPGPKAAFPVVNLELVADFVKRMWPETELPPTPPPESASTAAGVKGNNPVGKEKGKKG